MPRAFFIFAAVATAQPSTRVLLGRGNDASGWAPPAAPGSLSVTRFDTVPWSGLPFFNVTFNFTDGGWQSSISPLDATAVLDIPGLLSLSFSVFSPIAAQSMLVSFEDSTHTSRGSWPYLSTSGWTNITLSLNSSDWLPHADTPFLPSPLRGLSIGAGRGNEKSDIGWLGIADVYLTTSALPGAISSPITMTLLQPEGLGDGVVIAGAASDDVTLGVAVLNRLQQTCAANVSVQLRNSTGSMGEGGWQQCASITSLDAWSSTPLVCTISPSTAPAGFVTMRAVFASSACWSMNDTAQVVEGSVALVPPQPAYTPVTRNVHANVFGGQMEGSAPAAAAIGMWTIRSGPLWEWNQPQECWNVSECFDWGFYDGILKLSSAGIEVMIDARELCPHWASAKNDSGPTWASIPGPAHYDDYVQWLTVMFERYAPIATAVEVSNEDDGLAYFMPDHLPYDYTVTLSVSLINLTVTAMAASPSAAGLKVVGLSSSSFDLKQDGNGGTSYMQYEKAVLSAPGVIKTLDAVSLHPYANQVWIPWTNPGWGNFSFQFFNESTYGTNSTTAQLLAIADLMSSEAAAAGITDYTPTLWPSEWGYNLMMTVALSEGWALMHAALVAQGLVHLRSMPLAPLVQKAFYFAADDSCCAESNGFFGLWRSAQRRTGPNATADGEQPVLLPPIVPLPSVSAFATASVLVDVSSGRLAGIFVVDNTVNGGTIPAGGSQLPPSCVAFKSDPASPLHAPDLVALFILGHHYNDRTSATLTLSTPPSRIMSGLGAALPAGTALGHDATLTLSLAALPQYVELAPGDDAVAACMSLRWTE